MAFDSPLIINLITFFILMLPPHPVRSSADKVPAVVRLFFTTCMWVVLPELGFIAVLNDLGIVAGWITIDFGLLFEGSKNITFSVIILNALIVFGIVTSFKQLFLR